METTPKDLCKGRAKCLQRFVNEIWKLKFAEDPNYFKLKFLLTSVMLEEDKLPGLKFEWSRFKIKGQ
jgi:hypothetical protein